MQRLRYWIGLIASYWKASAKPADFLRVMRVRLAETKIGPLVARRPFVADLRLKELGSVRLRSHTSDIGVLEELVAARNYSHLPNLPVATVVDLGANIGLAMRWWHSRYPDARFVCVEPEPGNVEVLEANASVKPDTVVLAACVGGHERTVSLTADSGDWSWRMEGAGEVPVITMPSVLRAARMGQVDLLKCDIEGAEAELFEDCSEWIGNVRSLVVECHGDFTAADLQACLTRNGGRFETVYLEPNPAYGCETVTMIAR
jgi:FkbM family methyltransferase